MTSSPSSTATRSPFRGRLKKIVNAGKNLHYPRTEPRVRVIPFFVGSERTDYWNDKVQEDISVKAQIGRYRIRGYGARRPLPHLNDIAFRNDFASVEPDPDVVSTVELATSVGGRFGATPIDLSMPVMIAPDELRRALEVDEDRSREGLRPLRHLRQLGRGRPHPRGARGREARRRAVPRRPPRLERARDAPGRRRRDLHLAGREARARRPADGEEGDRGHRAPARHPGRHRPALAVAPPGRARRRRPRDQGRGVPRGDGLAEAGLGQARRRPHPRRHQDRLQGRVRLRLPRRRPGLDRAPPATRCSSTSASRPCRRSWRLSTLSRRSRRRACRSC